MLLVAFLMLLSFMAPFATAGTAQTYTVTFSETGLPQNQSWYVILNGSGFTTDSTNITFSEPNGSYYYYAGSPMNFNATPSEGNIIVNGSSIDIYIHFTVIYYSVTFNESGLPPGGQWQIDFAGENVQVNGSSYVFSEYKGFHPFTVTSMNSTYRPSPASGTIVIINSNVTQSISFLKVEFIVSFAEQGLTTGTIWYAELSGQNVSSDGTAINFQETNGSYTFYIPSIQGYVISGQTSGKVIVEGSNVTLHIQFIPFEPYTFIITGLGSGATWHLEIGGMNYTSNGSFITVYLPSGNYSYKVTLPYGYSGKGVTGTAGYYSNTVLITATNIILEYSVAIILFVLIDAVLIFYILRKRSRTADKK